MKQNKMLGINSRLLLLAGIADILASLAGFIFGAGLIVAAAVLHKKQYRAPALVIAPIALAIATFVSARTALALLYPPAFYYPQLLERALAFIMTPSPIFSLVTGSSVIINPYNEAVRMMDLVFNSAAIIFNFLGLGALVWGWFGLLSVDEASIAAEPQSIAPVTPRP